MKCMIVMAAAGLMLGVAQPESKPKSGAQVPAPAAQIGVKAELTSLAFLKGTWSGKMGEDWVEETWSTAHGDSIIGMFRWQGGGKVTTMWELLAIKDEGGVPTLRLRHFDQGFNAWPSESKEVERLPASVVEANRVVFSAALEGTAGIKSVEYKCPSADVLEITVSFRDEGRAALEFDLKKH